MFMFFKRWGIVVFALCLIISLIPVTPSKASPATDYTQLFGYTQMETEAQKRFYLRVCEAIVSLDTEGVIVSGDEGLTPDDFYEISRLLPYDLPQAFYFRGAHRWTRSSDGEYTFIPLYEVGSLKAYAGEENVIAEIRKMKERFDTQIERIINDIPSDIDTDYEKSEFVYEFLSNNIKYVETPYDQTAYGALIERKCVCAGYAAAYTLLMRELGVKTWTVHGIADNGQEIANHAWNVSWIEGECVYTDVTWGDGDVNTFYHYLNISGAEMAQDHTWDEKFETVLYECDHSGHKHETQAIKVTSISLKNDTRTMSDIGMTWQIVASVIPKDADDPELLYHSNDTSVVTVDDRGVVTAVGEGDATITIRSADGGALTTAKVTVKKPECKHELELVKLVDATCSKPGQKAHYSCSKCNAKYFDKNGLIKTEEEALFIAQREHTVGEWLYDDTYHWKECILCHEKLENYSTHDADSKGKCRNCGHQPEEGPSPSLKTDNEDLDPTGSQPRETRPEEDLIGSSQVETASRQELDATSRESVVTDGDHPRWLMIVVICSASLLGIATAFAVILRCSAARKRRTWSNPEN